MSSDKKNQYGEGNPWQGSYPWESEGGPSDVLNKGGEAQHNPARSENPPSQGSYPWESEGGPSDVLNKGGETPRDPSKEELNIQRAWMPHSLY